jgi:hypothetical protein
MFKGAFGSVIYHAPGNENTGASSTRFFNSKTILQKHLFSVERPAGDFLAPAKKLLCRPPYLCNLPF